MKRFVKTVSLILSLLLIFSLLSVYAFAENESASESINNPMQIRDDLSQTQIMIIAVLMFVVISVIGVMFIKTVQKDMKNRRH